MAQSSMLADEEFQATLKSLEDKDLLRFITCGSVDDGKSTLIGRLLHDSKLIFDDQLAAVAEDSKKLGSRGAEIDLALLVDGLQAEREQGITIDVAYRYFATEKRKFIVADTPGHEQYTRNMATGASTADLAVLLVDARKGVITQTRRHAFIASLLGIRHLVLAVNKMDLVEFSQARFAAIEADFRDFAKALELASLNAIPVCALEGDNVFAPSPRTGWYQGPALMELLEEIEVAVDKVAGPLRFPVQWINRPNADFRGCGGTLVSGKVSPGDKVLISPSGKTAAVERIVTAEGDLAMAQADQAVTLVLDRDVDVSRGDLLADPAQPPQQADQFAAHVIWMHDEPLLPERPYLIKLGHQTATAQITDLRYRVNVNTLAKAAASTLGLNEVGYCNLALDQVVSFDPYREQRATGSFILVDKFSNATLGAGMIDFGLRRAANLTWQPTTVDKVSRARQKKQRPCILWFTGLSGSGKSTAANLVEQMLQSAGAHTYLLDGDNVRHGLNKDLGFTDHDRVENIRRIAEVSKLFVDAGLIVLVAFISPFRSERRMAREMMQEGEFIEVFMDTPLAVCEERDPKGLYKKARAGKIANFTGIDSDYEPPLLAEIALRSHEAPPEELAEQVVAYLRDADYLR